MRYCALYCTVCATARCTAVAAAVLEEDATGDLEQELLHGEENIETGFTAFATHNPERVPQT